MPSWSFETGNPPFVESQSPAPSSSGNSINTTISYDIVDAESYVRINSIDAYVNGVHAFTGPSTFIAPYDGPSSSIIFVPGGSVDGYDAYRVVIDYSGSFVGGSTVTVRSIADDYGYNTNDETWTFQVNGNINTLYYSDSYGVYKINLEDLVGESQFVSYRFLSTDTSPSIPTNSVTSIDGKYIDGYLLLALSMGSYDGYGVKIVVNETSINPYADGYLCDKGKITQDGKLYLINKSSNQIEVYYGANTRSGLGRTPDFIYDGYSTPSLFSDAYGNIGEILCLHVVSGQSEELPNGTRLYVGQSIGMTIIDAFDQEASPGYSAGNDSYGQATYCSITGGGGVYECIGGTIPKVTDVATDEENGIIFVVTNDGYGNGGLTQVSMSGLRKIIFMDESSNFVPTNDIRNVTENK